MCKAKKKSKIKRGDIRFNYRHGHLAHVKKVYSDHGVRKATAVFMSSKVTSEGKNNLVMKKPINVGNKNIEYGYFIKRVRSYPANSYSDKIKKRLTFKDKRLSNKIYNTYLKNK